MTLSEFEDNIGRYGTAIDTWPQTVRAAALALLATSPEATRLLEQARLPLPPERPRIVAIGQCRDAPVEARGHRAMDAAGSGSGRLNP